MTFTTVSIGDTHPPFQDDRAIELACEIIRSLEPDRVIHHADAIDFYALSSYSRDPERITRLQSELDTAFQVNNTLKSAAPEAEWLYLNDGNHERRLWRFVCKNPELSGLGALEIENLMLLEKLGWRYVDPVSELDNALLWMHGKRVSKHSGRAVQGDMLDRFYQQCVLRAHSHRAGMYIAQGPNRLYDGYEIGCLCSLDPEYADAPNWIQGIAVTTHSTQPGSYDHSVEQVIFHGRGRSRRAIFRGKEFIAK